MSPRASLPERSLSSAILGGAPEDWQGRPVWAEIDLDALQGNVRALRAFAGDARLMAIIKANGYGHGAVPVARAALDAGATELGVICLDEGVELRAAGIAASIVILGHTPVAQAADVILHRLSPTVNSLQLGLALSAAAVKAGLVLPVHVKVDTGMARYGLRPNECVALAESLRELPDLVVEGVFTHFASADEPDQAFTHYQYAQFLDVVARLPWVPVRHAAASAALIGVPETTLDMARVGIAMYGYAPAGGAELGLRPVLALKSRIVRIYALAAGETVSYGRTWRAQRPTRVGLVMAGYADGVPWALSNRGEALVRGRRVPIIGRVCMDQFIVDLNEVPDAKVDDVAVIIGPQGSDFIGAEEVARLSETISYEVLTGISARVARLYVRGGKVVEVRTLVESATAARS